MELPRTNLLTVNCATAAHGASIARSEEIAMSSALQLPRKRLLALDPATLETYLVAHGWEMDPDLSSSEAGIYHLSADPQAEIIIPRDKSFVDYALRVGEAVWEVADTEHRKAWDVLEEISRQQAGTSANGPTASDHPTKRPTRGQRNAS